MNRILTSEEVDQLLSGLSGGDDPINSEIDKIISEEQQCQNSSRFQPHPNIGFILEFLDDLPVSDIRILRDEINRRYSLD